MARKARTYRVNGRRPKVVAAAHTYKDVLENPNLTKKYFNDYKKQFQTKQQSIFNQGYSMAIPQEADLGDFEWYLAARGNDLTAKYGKMPSAKSIIKDMVNQQAYTKSWHQSAVIAQAANRQGIAVDFNDILYGRINPYEIEKQKRIDELVADGLSIEEATHYAIDSLANEWFDSN